MSTDRVVVIGASAGGLEAVRDLLAELPASFAAAVMVVIHVGASGPSFLAEILGRAGPLPVSEAIDGEPLLAGHVYVSVPDRHLLVQGGRAAVRRGPKENRFRPSVDALFRSAAYTHGPGVIAVVLSGMLDDGTSGLWTVKQLGGVSVVQTPSDALYDSMPRSALAQVEVDYVLPVSNIGRLLSDLVRAPLPDDERPLEDGMDDTERRRLEVEVQAAADEPSSTMEILHLGQLSPLTCPDCHGVLVRVQEGKLIRFRCHTGHAYTASSLALSVSESVERSLYQAMRALEEATLLFGQLEQHHLKQGEPGDARHFHEQSLQALQFSRQIQGMTSRPVAETVRSASGTGQEV
ncbi:chemotaxis protein CheB [Deinococcus sp.]|uniref:chemotaxis protein CheB n=1 Tax=Deinococcus sp. TaxID=47478 RepID=UPI003C7ADCE0